MTEEVAPAPEPMKGAFGANTVPETPDPTHDPAAYIGDGHYAAPSRAMPPIRFVPSPSQSSRLPAGIPIRLIVAHDCQGSADGAVAYFATRKSEVSAHLVIPETGDFVYQCVPLSMKAWHAVAYNSCSIGVEMGGYAEKGFSDGELDLSALTIAWLLRAYGLPCVFVTDGTGEGWTTHYRLGKAGGGHTDFTTDPEKENAFAERVYSAYEKFGDGPLPSWALHGAPAPHSVSLPPAMPEGWSPTPMVMKNPGDTPAGGPVSGYVPGSIGDIQFRLRLVGANPLLVVDGIDGPATESALEVFERSCGLPVTKTINPATWAKLEEMSAGRIANSPLVKAALPPQVPAAAHARLPQAAYERHFAAYETQNGLTPAPVTAQFKGNSLMSLPSVDNIVTTALSTIADVEALAPSLKADYEAVKAFATNPALLAIESAWKNLFTHTVTAGAAVVVEPVSQTPGKA